MDFQKNKFAELLKSAKGKRSINQYGKESGVDPGYISRLMRGLINTPPSANIIKKLGNQAHHEISTLDLLTIAGYLGDEIKENTPSYKPDQLYAFSFRLKHGLRNAGVSALEAANECKISEDYITRLMNGPEGLPGVGTLYRLAELISVSPDYLGGFTNDPEGFDTSTPRPKDMKEFLEREEVMLDGQILNDEDKEMIQNVLSAVFMEAKKRNKRK